MVDIGKQENEDILPKQENEETQSQVQPQVEQSIPNNLEVLLEPIIEQPQGLQDLEIKGQQSPLETNLITNPQVKNVKKLKDEVWFLKFYGSRSKQGSGAGVELTSPKGKTFLASYRLQFPFTNNMMEYEALIRGLLFPHKKGAKCLRVQGDSELVVKQVRSQYACHDKRLATYKNRVWGLVEYFDAFNIQLVLRKVNGISNALAVAASTLELVSQSPLKKFSVELVSTPVVPDNIHFQFFKDDTHILAFLAKSGAFEEQIIDEKDRSNDLDEGGDEEIMDLPMNFIPKGMVTLERLFDSNPMVKERLTMDSVARKYEPYNIGPEGQEKMVYIGKICTPNEREKILQILKEYIDVIAWRYEDLKNF